MTISALYRWRRFSSQHQVMAGDYLKLSISVCSRPNQVNNYTYTVLKHIDSRPFVCLETQRFLDECREFLSTFLSDLHSIPTHLTDLVMPVIRNRFMFVLKPPASSAPKEFNMRLIIVLIEDGVGRVDEKNFTSTEYDPEIQRSHQQFSRGVMVPASGEAILRLLKKSKVNKSDEWQCLICLEEFTVSGNDGDDANCIGEEAYSMPCGHMFHQHCILTWLLTSHMCPTCRSSLPTIDH